MQQEKVSDFAKHFGLGHKVFKAGELAGFTPEQWNALAENQTMFNAFHNVIIGSAEIKIIADVIDGDADPYIPEGYSVARHSKNGIFEWSSAKIKLWLSTEQQKRIFVKGYNIYDIHLKKMPVLNANVLDHLLKNPHLIPASWKAMDKKIFFWGTIYYALGGELHVRFLYLDGNQWQWGFGWFGHELNDHDPAALIVV